MEKLETLDVRHFANTFARYETTRDAADKNDFLSLLFLLLRDECDTFYDSPFSEREENVDDDDDESKVASREREQRRAF
jgi:hypothetical protein